jgi:hypothetical protein
MVVKKQPTFGMAILALGLVASQLLAFSALAITVTSNGNTTVTAVVASQVPTTLATISVPTNGSIFETTPSVLSGSCGAGFLVRVFDNGHLAGSIICEADDTYTMNITLVVGTNVLTALNFNADDVAGPPSPSVTVTVKAPIIRPIGQAEASAGADESVSAPLQGGDVRMFEGSVVEPLAKVLGLEQTVSPAVNNTVTAAINVVFFFSIAGAILLVLFVPLI